VDKDIRATFDGVDLLVNDEATELDRLLPFTTQVGVSSAGGIARWSPAG
jgi:hypothetical protein